MFRIFVSESFVVNDYLQVPKLDGTDSKYQISGTTIISNGEMSGGCGYLSVGFDNTGDWELTCKYKVSGRNCAISLFPTGATALAQNEFGMTAYRTNTFWYNNGTYAELYTSNRHLVENREYDVKITKQNGVITTLIDGITRSISAWSSSSANTLHIGVAGWGTTGNVCTIKNVVVKPL